MGQQLTIDRHHRQVQTSPEYSWIIRRWLTQIARELSRAGWRRPNVCADIPGTGGHSAKPRIQYFPSVYWNLRAPLDASPPLASPGEARSLCTARRFEKRAMPHSARVRSSTAPWLVSVPVPTEAQHSRHVRRKTGEQREQGRPVVYTRASSFGLQLPLRRQHVFLFTEAGGWRR